MKPTINPKATQLANKYRQTDGSEYEGGLVVVRNNEVCGWMNELRDPQGWMPGCIAVDIDGNQWVAMGGNDYDGADKWVTISSGNDESKGKSMNNTQHLMIDIEAAGKSTSAALLSIGAVFFDPATGELGETFYRAINLASSQYHGGEVDASTIGWWMQQSEEARAVFNDVNRVTLKKALTELSTFIESTAGEAEVYVWGNGPAYDNAILATAFHATWIKQPWSFSKDTCVRTMVMLGRQLSIDPKYDMTREGEHHNALDDAIHQARYVSVIWQALFNRNISYEVVDTTSDEMHYPLGIFASLEAAKKAIHQLGDKKISDFSEDCEQIRIYERPLGWGGWNNGHKEVLVFNREFYHDEEVDEERCRLISDDHKRQLHIAVEKIDALFSGGEQA